MDKLLEAILSRGIITADDVRRLTATELLLLIIERINLLYSTEQEMINLVKQLLDGGLRDEVIKQLTEWKENGVLEELINQTIFDGLNRRLDEIESEVMLYSAQLSSTDEHGSFTIIKSPKVNLLVDCGFSGQEAEIDKVMNEKGISHLDVVILTHFDADHSGCASHIINHYCDNQTLFFRQMICDYTQLTSDTTSNQEQEQLYEQAIALNGYGANNRIPLQNEKVVIGDMNLRFLNTADSFKSTYYQSQSDTNATVYNQSTLNNFALIVEIKVAGKTILMSGDVEQPAQIKNSAFIEKCDIMQVPHHNWNHNGYYKFFDNAAPKFAFYNRNLPLKDAFVYFAKYQRQTGQIIPTYYTYGEAVEMRLSYRGIEVVSGAKDENRVVNGDSLQLIADLPYYTDTTHNYWQYASWTIKDVLTMAKELPYDVTTPLFTNSRYTKLIEEIRTMTGLNTNLLITLNGREMSLTRQNAWDGRNYIFKSGFDINNSSTYESLYIQSRVSMNNKSDNNNLGLAIGGKVTLSQSVRSPQRLMVQVKSVRDSQTYIYTIPVEQKIDSQSEYETLHTEVTIDSSIPYLRMIKVNFRITDNVVTLNDCKIIIYNLSTNVVNVHDCTIERIKGLE